MNIAFNRNHVSHVSKEVMVADTSNCFNVAKLNQGDILKGTVAKVSSQVSINFNGNEIGIPRDAMPNAKEGDIVNFQVVKISDQGVELKQMDGASQKDMNEENKTMVSTMVVTDYVDTSNEEETICSEKEECTKEGEQQLEDIFNQMTEEDYEELSKEGLSLEDFNLERFERALERIKAQKAQISNDINQKVERKQEVEQSIKQASVASNQNSAIAKVIVQLLENSNLPVTKSNIVAIEKALAMSKQASALSDTSMEYMLQHELEPTIMNLYVANYSTLDEVCKTKVIDQSFDEVAKQATELVNNLKSQGVMTSIQDAKWLFKHNLPIDTSTINAYQELLQIKENCNDEHIIKAIIDTMSVGGNSLHANLSMANSIEVQQAIDGFESITDSAIYHVISKQDELNLKTLQKADYALATQDNTKEEQYKARNEVTTSQELKFITAKRQLEEIRVKLTFDAGLKLWNKGIQINTQGLDTLVEELKTLENNCYEKLLSEAGAKVNKENIQILQNTAGCIQSVKSAPSYVLGTTIANRDQICLGELADASINIESELAKVSRAYEPLMTTPRADMGDSIKKAFQNVDHILEDLGLDTTKENQRAVRILGYSEMDITKSNIDQMKNYDMKVNHLMEQLQPSVTVELIKKQINPMNTPLDELAREISEIKQELGVSQEEKYSNYLAKIQKSDTLTQEQRDAYIGIYRLLNNVEKTDGKAIGYLVKADRELTLTNLLSAVRTIKGGTMDASVNDKYGLLNELTYETKSITTQLEQAFAPDNDWQRSNIEYNKQINSKLYHNVTPDFFEQTAKSKELMDLTLEAMYDTYQDYAAKHNSGVVDYEQFVEIGELLKNSEKEIAFLNDYYISPTMNNIKSAKHISPSGTDRYKKINEATHTNVSSKMEQETVGKSTTLSELQDNYKTYLEMENETIKNAFSNRNLTVEGVVQLNNFLSDHKLLEELSDKNYYQIPIEVDGETIGISVAFQNGKKDTNKVEIETSSTLLGTIRAQFKLKKQELSGFILCNNNQSVSKLQGVVDQFTSEVNQSDLKIRQIHLGFDEQMSKVYHYRNNVREEETQLTQAQDMLVIAKSFITAVKRSTKA